MRRARRSRRAKRATESGEIEAALQRWERPLLRYAASIVGAERARDIVQETFLRLWERAPADRAPASAAQDRDAEGLAPWLFTVCRNRAIDVARKEGRVSSLAVEPRSLSHRAGASLSVSGAEPGAATPFDEAAHREDADRLASALATLPERQRELVRLRYRGGLSYKEIAATAGLTVTNVGFLLHTSLRALRAHLNSADSPRALAGGDR